MTIFQIRPIIKWREHRSAYLDKMLRLDGWYYDSTSCSGGCESQTATHRCLDCFNSKPSCAQCLVKSHHEHPLHIIEVSYLSLHSPLDSDLHVAAQKWNGLFWECSSLASLGLVINFGHFGNLCPDADSAPRSMTVVHVNGVHRVYVNFCTCYTTPEAFLPRNQLLRCRWYSASLERPKTVVTFEALDLFHQCTTQGKISAYDFYMSVRQRSCNTGVGESAVCQYLRNHRDRILI